MQFKIRLVPNPGDDKVDRAGLMIYDATGNARGDQIVLEGETVETDVSLGIGEKMVVTELQRPLVYDREQHASMPADLTPKDPLTDPNAPTVGHHVKEAVGAKIQEKVQERAKEPHVTPAAQHSPGTAPKPSK